MKKIFLSLLSVCVVFTCMAQEEETNKVSKKAQRKQRINAMSKSEEEGVISYRKHFVVGGKLTNDGYGAFVEVGRAQSVSRGLLFQLEMTERKHPKEEKQAVSQNGSPIIYGKINFFYPVKLGVQQQVLLGNKGNKNGVSITGNIGGGLIVGLLRPYLVEVQKQGNNLEFVGYDGADSSYFLNGPFYGGPGLGKGWGQITVVPGIYVKPALRFDYGKYNEMVNAIEVGLTGEFYSKKIPQMVYSKYKQFFFGAYVAIVFGRRK
ncbi:MAG: hypothetical protein ABIY51_08000 [Ferruginibacter sp.]